LHIRPIRERLDLSVIFGIDFRVLALFPDLLAELIASFRDIYLECVPFLGPAKSAAKAVIGYSKQGDRRRAGDGAAHRQAPWRAGLG